LGWYPSWLVATALGWATASSLAVEDDDDDELDELDPSRSWWETDAAVPPASTLDPTTSAAGRFPTAAPSSPTTSVIRRRSTILFRLASLLR
jgi:hypothetical protein